jgi:xylulokinase
MPSSWLAFQLTGNYLLDHHSASQSTPLYDIEALEWYEPFTSHIAPQIQFPPLVWPGDIAGEVSSEAAAATGLPMGTPVIAGTIDAWSEAVSVGATNPGDLMLMYGTTMFLINTVACQVTSPELWSTVGTYPGARCLAGGMATSGAITAWLKEILGSHDFNELTEKAAKSPAGANGLLMLPYFAGERTPIFDPDARGVIAGLTLTHTEGDLFRAALEATAFGVRHNIEAIEAVSGTIAQVTAVGGGVTSRLWTQIVSDITGKPQLVRQITIGASYGAARLAAATDDSVPVEQWNPPLHTVVPNDKLAGSYTEIYQLYRSLYPATREISHALAAVQRDRSSHL